MKKKFSRILGVALTIALIALLMISAPVAAAPAGESLPSAPSTLWILVAGIVGFAVLCTVVLLCTKAARAPPASSSVKAFDSGLDTVSCQNGHSDKRVPTSIALNVSATPS